MKKITQFLFLALSVSLFVSCSNDDSDNPKGVYDDGFFILNEGSADGGSVSFVSEDLSTFNADVYKTVNGADFVGKYLQNIFFDGDKAYIISGGSNVINVVNRYTFQLIAKIDSDLANPRYGVVKDGKAYVTNANTYSYSNPATGDTDDYVAVINLATNKVESKIALNSTANRIIEENNKLYITDASNSKLLILNPSTKALEGSVEIGFGANGMEEEDGYLYILKNSYTDRSEIVKVKLSDKTIAKITFPESLDSGQGFLDIEDNKIYYTANNDVYVISTSATAASTTPIFTAAISTDGSIYGFAVEDNKIYIGDSGDYSSNSKAFVYNLSGALLKDFTVGIAPNGFYFND
ncbi:hypothetical protein B4N84_13210 [Flavobacterium sp. IR1]|nr:hypothetical protein B4N84_13210 [Flavobacterium sp. IR1]